MATPLDESVNDQGNTTAPAASESDPSTKTVPAQSPTATAPEKTGTGGSAVTFESEEAFNRKVTEILKERLAREQAKAQAAADKARQEAEAEAAAKNGEWEKLARQREQELAQIQAQLKAREFAERQRAAAEKIGLPLALAARLVGETDEELEADARTVADAFPKQTKAPAPQPGPTQLSPTNPGLSGQVGETPAQALARIHGISTNPWDPGVARSSGGGVTMPDNQQ